MLILKLVCVGEAVHVNTVATEAREVSNPPDGETNLGPLEEQYVRITAAPPLQPPSSHSGPMQKGSHGAYEQRSCSDDSRVTL